MIDVEGMNGTVIVEEATGNEYEAMSWLESEVWRQAEELHMMRNALREIRKLHLDDPMIEAHNIARGALDDG